MRPYSFTLAAGKSASIPVDGDTIYVQTSNGSLTFSARQELPSSDGKDLLSSIVLREGSSQRSRGSFNRVVIENQTTSSVTATVIMGFGELREPQVSVLLQQPTDLKTSVDANITDASTQILGVNSLRFSVIVQNVGLKNIRLGDANVAAAQGILLVPNGSVTLTTTGAIYAVAETAGDTSKVSITEQVQS